MKRKLPLTSRVNKEQFERYYFEGASDSDLCDIYGLSRWELRLIKSKYKPAGQNMTGFLCHYKKWFNLHNGNMHQRFKAYALGFMGANFQMFKQYARLEYMLRFEAYKLDMMKNILIECRFNGCHWYNKKDDMYTTIIKSEPFIKMLQMYFMDPNVHFKTYPRFREREISYHFLRGYIDGGGGYISCDSKIPYIKINGGKGFVSKIMYETGFKFRNNQPKVKQDKNYYYIRFSGALMREFLEKLYPVGCQTLDRTYMRVCKILGRYDEIVLDKD